MARLGDIIEQIRGVSYKPEDVVKSLNETSIVLLRANNIRDGQLNFDDVIYIDKKRVNQKQLLKAGDILICTSSGSKELVGKAAYVAHDLPMSFGAFCKVVRSKKIEPKYLGYFFNCPYYQRKILDSASGANINNIRNEHIDNIEISIPQLSRQQYVISILDKLTTLISLRKQQLAKLDELVKARFVEMFNQISIEKYVTLKEACRIITDGTHQPPKFIENGVPFLFVSNIVGNVITYDTEKFISEETYNELIKRTPIEIGDILLSTVGSYGHPAIVKSQQKFCFQRHIAYLKPQTEKIDSEYLHSALLSNKVQMQIEKRIKGIAQKTLNLSEIKMIQIPLPKIELQKEFASFVQRIYKSKLIVQQSLDKMEILKKSLMQKFFTEECYD